MAPVRGLGAITPLSFPEPVRRRNVRLLTKVIRSWLDEMGARECLLIFYWWALPELVASIPNTASIYDCIDDHAAIPGSIVPPQTVARLEGQLLDAVDRTYVVSSGLVAARAAPGREISVLPNGFDLNLFERLTEAGFTQPQALRSIPKPIIGYAGGLGSRMDWDLLAELAARRPGWSFVFVGGNRSEAPEALRRQPNTYFLGMLPYPDALAAIGWFDVATIPANVQQFSLGNSFLKLLDYFAHGTPVVATPLPDTVRVSDTESGLLELAQGVDGWLSALERALEEPETSPLRAARRRLVEARSVKRRIDQMLGETLGGLITDWPAG